MRSACTSVRRFFSKLRKCVYLVEFARCLPQPASEPERNRGATVPCFPTHTSAAGLTTLSRYLIKEHLGPFVLALTLIVFVLVLDLILQTMDQVLSKGLSLELAARLFLYNLAWIFALAVPMAVLVAVLMAFARLAADNEIMAARACGIGFLLMLRPVLVAAAVLTVVMILFNDWILPDWNYRARNIASNLKRLKAALVLKEKEGVFIHKLGNKYSLLIRQVDEKTNTLKGITLYDRHRSSLPTTLHAASGRIHIFGDGSYIRLTLYDGEFHRVEGDDHTRFVRGVFRRKVIHIQDPQRAFSERTSAYRGQREMNVRAMYQAVQKRRRERDHSQASMDSALQSFIADLSAAQETVVDSTIPGPFATNRAGVLEKNFRQQWRLDAHRKVQIAEFWVEIHKKFSIPFACLVFVLVGAPLGVLIRQRGAAVSVGVSLVFFLVYWMFLIGGEELADRGFVPPSLAMWTPNIVFGLLGAGLIRVTVLGRPLGSLRHRKE